MRPARSIGLIQKGIASRRGKAAVMAALLAAGSYASAGIPGFSNVFTNPTSGDWTDPANWSYGLAPTYADNSYVNNGGTAVVTDGDNAQAAFVQIDGTSAVSMTGGNFTSIADFRSGYAAGDNSNFTQSGGNLVIANRGGLWAGNAGNGTITLSGGTTTVGNPYSYGTDYGDIIIGNGTGGVGTLNINGGTLTNYALTLVGRSGGTGNVNMTAGTWNIPGEFGYSTDTGKNTIVQSGGTINVGTFVSYPHNTATVLGSFVLGAGSYTPATRSSYTMSGDAQLNINAQLYVGGGAGSNPASNDNLAGHADLIMNGGTITLGNSNNQTGVLYVGNSTATASADGTVTLNTTDSTLNAPIGIVLGQRQTTGAASGTGVLTINAGKVLTPKGSVTIGRVSGTQGAAGTINLAGGLLQTGSLIWVKPSTGTPTQAFNWTGGELDINSANDDYAMVNNGGTLSPGSTAPGTFTLTGKDGSYTQTAAGTLNVNLTNDYSYSSVNATGGTIGTINLAGAVNTTLGSGYTPAYGATFQVLAGKTVSDTASWNLPALPSGFSWDQRIIAEGGNQIEVLSMAPTSSTPLSAGSWTGPGAVDAAYSLNDAGGSLSVDSNVTAGYLQVGGTGNWSLDGAGTLTFSASSGRAGLTAFGNATIINAPIQFTGDGVIGTASAGTSVTINGTVAGSGTITKTGAGTLALANSGSSFSGTWAIAGGALNINDDTNLGAAGANLSVSSANVNVTNAWNTSRAIALQGTGMTLTIGADSTLSGVISGAGGLTKTAANNLTLAGANTYTGATTISGGTLTTAAANTIPSGSAVLLQGATGGGATLNLNGNSQTFASLASIGSLTASVVTGGADLTVGSDNTNTQFRGNIDGGGSGTFTKVGTGLFEVTGVAGTPNVSINTAAIEVAGGILQYDNLTFGALNLPSGTITVDAGAALSLGGAGVGGYVSTPITGAGSLRFHGGKIEMSQANDYTGDTELRLGSNVLIDDMGVFGSSTAPLVAVPATLAFSNANTLTFDVGGTFSKPIVINAPATLSINAASAGDTVTLDQPVTGDGTFNLTAGTIALAAQNTNNSPTVITGASVQLGIDNAISSSQYTLVNGTLDLNGFDQTVGSLIGLNTGKIILSAANTLTMGADNRDNNGISSGYPAGYAGILTGAGGLTKIGGGLALMTPKYDAGNLPFTGATEVQMGALRWDTDSRTLNSTSGITVDSGALMIFNFTTAGSGAATPVISVPISGSGQIEKDNTDVLQLSGANTYTGGTRIYAGTLMVGADNNLGTAPAVPSANINFPGAGTLQFTSQFNLDPNRGIVLPSNPAVAGSIDTNTFNVSALGPIAGNGGFTKAGLGTLTVNSISSGGAVTASAGVLQVAHTANGTNVVSAASVAVASGAQLDLTNNKLITNSDIGSFNGTSYTGVTGLVASGRNGGTWNGSGIITSETYAASPSILTTLAVATGAQAKGLAPGATAVWAGQTISDTSTLVMYTYAGDANLDGRINGDDYFAIDSHVNTVGASGYANGDFNLDGHVNGDDYFLIDSNINQQSLGVFSTSEGFASASSLGGISAVPEPTSIALMSLGAMAMLSRRRRRGA